MKQSKRNVKWLVAVLSVNASVACAEIETVETLPSEMRGSGTPSETNWLTGEDFTIGGIFSPHLHVQSVYGLSSATEVGELAVGHHDPAEEGWNLQALELGLSARFTESVEAFGVYAWKLEPTGSWVGEAEEYFIKFKNLPGEADVRLGQFYNRFGLQNTMHPHGFDWVDQYLVNGRMLGEDGLLTLGGDITLTAPLPWTSLVSISIGQAPSGEEHAHEHAEEEEAEEESEFEAEGAGLDGLLATANITNIWGPTDFHNFRAGASAAVGENLWERTTQIYGAHFEYEWREKGFGPGGKYFRWRTEGMIRLVEARTGHLPGEESAPGEVHERSRAGEFVDFGLYTSATYGQPIGQGIIEGSLRYDYVSGADSAGLAERHRFSPAVTWYPNTSRTFYLRAQYNHDRSGEGQADSLWVGLGLNWGGAEVR